MQQLSKKHFLFVEAYTGDPVEAMRLAGYTGADNYLKQRGEQLLSQPLIQEAIKNRCIFKATMTKAIATREERQRLWTDIMQNEDPFKKPIFDEQGLPVQERDENIPLATRLKASELLGKSEADFIEKIDMSVQHSLSDIILSSYKVEEDKSIEAIEAEYIKLKELKALPKFNLVTEDPIEDLEDLI